MEEEKKEDDKPKGPPPKAELNLFSPKDFGEALKEQISRPFIFGPVEFTGLDQDPEEQPFPATEWHQVIENTLCKSVYLPANLCIHGFHITAKNNKTLKRASTIVKHSRFVRNMVVYPMFPPELPKTNNEAAQAEKPEGDDDE